MQKFKNNVVHNFEFSLIILRPPSKITPATKKKKNSVKPPYPMQQEIKFLTLVTVLTLVTACTIIIELVTFTFLKWTTEGQYAENKSEFQVWHLYMMPLHSWGWKRHPLLNLLHKASVLNCILEALIIEQCNNHLLIS